MDMIEILAWHKEFKKQERAEIEAAVRAQMMQEQEALQARERAALDAQKQALDAHKQEREHLFERRLGRPLTTEERATLATRVQELGAEKVGDILLDSTKEELAAWLATS